MSERRSRIEEFVEAQGWAGADMRPVAGDASMRAYFRLENADRRAILMDADPARGEDIRPFVRIAKYLRATGLSAPDILAEDPEQGFLLLEDLGDGLYARLLESGAADETTLYSAAIDVLAHLHRMPPPSDLLEYDIKLMAELAALAVIWYRRGVLGEEDDALTRDFEAGIKAALAPTESGPRVLIQRDYHAENLIWLPDRVGVARVGLLDFQDAMLGHPAYDLTSVLQDARRDVPESLEHNMFDRYLTATGTDPERFRAAYAALGLQRNLRIVGVFARLWMRDGKPGYLRLIPRVWRHVEKSLERLGDRELTRLVIETLPKPDTAALDRIREAR